MIMESTCQLSRESYWSAQSWFENHWSIHLEIIIYQVWQSVEFVRSSLERSRFQNLRWPWFLYALVQCFLITMSLTSPTSNLFLSTRCHRSASNYSKLVWFYCSRPGIHSISILVPSAVRSQLVVWSSRHCHRVWNMWPFMCPCFKESM